MKKLIAKCRYSFLLLVLLLMAQPNYGKDVFQKANEAYKNANYQLAIDSYESILKAKKHSAELYFNLGNCYFKINKIGPAIYHYEKALMLEPAFKDAKINLTLANQKKIDAIKEKPPVGVTAFFRKFTGIFHYDTWAIWSIVNLLLAVGCFAGFYMVHDSFKKRLFFTGIFLGGVLMLVSLFAGFFEKNNIESQTFAIIYPEEISVKNEPLNQSAEAFKLHEGTKVSILETDNTWSKIYINDDLEGWVLNKDLKFL